MAVATAFIAVVAAAALALAAMRGPGQVLVPPVCGAYLLPNGSCAPIPEPGDPGATCALQPDGSCSWVWKSPHPTN